MSWLEILKEASHFGNLGVDELSIKMDVRSAGPQDDLDEVGTSGGLCGHCYGPLAYSKCKKNSGPVEGLLACNEGSCVTELFV